MYCCCQALARGSSCFHCCDRGPPRPRPLPIGEIEGAYDSVSVVGVVGSGDGGVDIAGVGNGGGSDGDVGKSLQYCH